MSAQPQDQEDIICRQILDLKANLPPDSSIFFSATNCGLDNQGRALALLTPSETNAARTVHLFDLESPVPAASVRSFRNLPLFGCRTNPARSQFALLYEEMIAILEWDEEGNEYRDKTQTEWERGRVPNWWGYINVDTIAFVDKGSVLHWNVLGSEGVMPWFTLNTEMAWARIRDIQTSQDKRLRLLVGFRESDETSIVQLLVEQNGVNGVEQLPAQAASMANVVLPDQVRPSCFLITASIKGRRNSLTFKRCGSVDMNGFREATVPFGVTREGDKALGVHLDPENKMVILITRLGYYLVFDLPSLAARQLELVLMYQLSAVSLFASAFSPGLGGVVVINSQGKVLSVRLNRLGVVAGLEKDERRKELGERLMGRWGLTQSFPPKRETGSLNCIVCRDRPRSRIFRPCRHVILCDICALRVDVCPVCRAQIVVMEEVYL